MLDLPGEQVRIDLIKAGVAAMALALGTVAQAAAEPIVPLDRASLGIEQSLDSPAVSRLDAGFDFGDQLLAPRDVRLSTLDLTDKWHLEFAQASLDGDLDLIQLQQGVAAVPTGSLPVGIEPSAIALKSESLSWNTTDWASLNLTVDSTSTGLIRDFDVAPFSAPSFTNNGASAGVAARVKLGDGWITSFSYNVGVAQLSLKDGNSAPGSDSVVQSRSFGVAIAKHGLFGDQDALGLSVSRKTEGYFGNVSLAGLDNQIDLLSNYRRVSLAADGHETDLSLGYVTTFLDGALALQANAGYQMNVSGQNGANSLTVLSRAKINF